MYLQQRNPMSRYLLETFILRDGTRRILIPRPLTHQGCVSGDRILFHPRLRGGKSVIYHFSPTAVDSVQKKSIAGGGTIEWQVRVHPDGTLTERNTGLDVAYLFWEALTNPDVPMTPPGSPLLGQLQVELRVAQSESESFSPTTCNLTSAYSVLLPVSAITLYLDETFRKLGLHTEARTSFITARNEIDHWMDSPIGAPEPRSSRGCVQ
ncbi:hypothetical protein C8R44DRAFT_750269 [Mycena epipterygia]|nr:hypothetical protein C8R44DRAFT_750269 [Mycena epipterygia]